MNTYQDLVTVVELGPLETAIFCVLLTAILVFFTISARTGVGGEFVGFDFTWIKSILKDEGKTE